MRPASARQPRAGRRVLPLQQEADEARRRHGLDFAAQASDGAPVDARQNTAVAELLALGAGPEPPAQHDALRLQPDDRLRHRPFVERQHVGEACDGERSRRLGARPHDARDRVLPLNVCSPLLSKEGSGEVQAVGGADDLSALRGEPAPAVADGQRERSTA